MGYLVHHDKVLSEVHKYKVNRYTCEQCGEEVACNGSLDEDPGVNFCKYCGHNLK